MEYCAAIKKKCALTCATTSINIENMKSERIQSQKTTYTIPFIEMSRGDKPIVTVRRLVFLKECKKGQCRGATNTYVDYLRVADNILIQIVMAVAKLYSYIKNQ